MGVVSQSVDGGETNINCIPLRECPWMLELLKKKPLPKETVEFLRSSQCGYENNHPNVWCPGVKVKCSTKKGESGK